MRLLFLEQRPRFGGGSERMSLSICKHAIARGHEAWLAHAEDGDMISAYTESGAICTREPITPMAIRKTVTAATSASTLRRLVRGRQIDVVFTSQVNYVSLLAFVGLLTSVRTAVHLGLTYDYPSPLFRTGIRLVGLGVAPSEQTAAGWRARSWPARSLRVIPNAVDLSVFHSGEGRCAARRGLGVSDASGPLVVYVGRIVREKGIFTLLRAFARFRHAGGRAYLMFVGDAPAGEDVELEAAARGEGLDGADWEIRPSTPHPDRVFQAADLVVVPSEWDEPFGLVPLEAMACGTMTIVSDRGLLPDFVARVGARAVFEAGNADALCRCLSHWLGAGDARERAALVLRQDVHQRFGFERCGDAYLDAFQELVA